MGERVHELLEVGLFPSLEFFFASVKKKLA